MQTLKPGFLVSLKSTLKGGVHYERTDLASLIDPTGAHVSKWETERQIDDPEEHDRAVKARGRCRNLIISVCAQTEFGLLCPVDREADLRDAIAKAQLLAAEWNTGARTVQIGIYVITGRIAHDDVEAAKAINAEIADLIQRMEQGIASADPKAIREAAAKAKLAGSMLSDVASEKLNSAIEQSRNAATALVKRVEKQGEIAANVVASLNIDAIEAARFAFLDLDQPTAPAAMPLEVVAPTIDLPSVEV